MFKSDSFFKWLCLASAALIGILMLGFFIQLTVSSSEIWQTYGLGFLASRDWDPVNDHYGALPSIVGTLVTTTISLIIALPLAFSAALYLVDARPLIGEVLGHAIDLLAAIPSIIYGMWGLFVLAPLMQDYVEPFLVETLKLSSLPVVGKYIGSDYNGFGLLTAGIILSIMILPYICAILRDVFLMTPPMLRESAYGIGCTKWETAKDIVLRYGIRGILGAIFIGLGRALGETMAVLFVIGNIMDMPENLLSGATTIASTLANNFPEADGLQRSALFALGLVLLTMSFGIQILAQYYLHATSAKRGEER
ncbi:MAG: Phosphate transport system permease protein PstC [Lentisphaerae bacterium ADurb.Bin082]|nr:MAG: Phosphate transport system permease protein PstC [Lentisphaerae bacterium ADurb.Bin082]HQL87906.1 phosphate ABC transporter permease subunit PstC [Lentisphaeria bacterium]